MTTSTEDSETIRAVLTITPELDVLREENSRLRGQLEYVRGVLRQAMLNADNEQLQARLRANDERPKRWANINVRVHDHSTQCGSGPVRPFCSLEVVPRGESFELHSSMISNLGPEDVDAIIKALIPFSTAQF